MVMRWSFFTGFTSLALIVLALSAQPVMAGSHPNMYLNQAEIDAIKNKLNANMEPWSSAYSQVISAANAALNQSPLSVTFQGSANNRYFTEKPYCGWPDGCRDGQINPDADRGDYESIVTLGNAVRDLGLGYAFTGQARYADKAIELIRVWSLDAATRMTPTTEAANRIELFIGLPGYFYGADLIWRYSGWNAGDKAAFTRWVKALGDHAKANGAGLNNFANWRVVLIAAAGALLDDNALLDFAETEWKRLVPLQMNGSGKMGQEYSRSKGLHYSLYAINAMIQGAEILRHRNVDLYGYTSNGKGLALALDYITPYAINPGSWPYQQITTITQNDSMALYELAYSYYKKPLYLEAINFWTRPLNDIRVMGVVTLTHANRFELSLTPTPPSIVTQPAAVTATEGGDARFSIAVTGSAPLTYQWFRDGTPIADATAASYTLTGVTPSDDGSVYRCEVSNSLGSVNSSDAVLTVLSDTTAPTLVSAFAVSDTRVDIQFSEAVSVSSASNIANYQVNLGTTVSAATLSGDGRTVTLTVSPLTEATTYTVSVNNVQDMADSANIIMANSSQMFTYLVADGFENSAAEGWTPLGATNWRVQQDGGDMAYCINADANVTSLSGSRLGEYSLLSTAYGDFTFTLEARLGADVVSNVFADYAVVFGYQDPENYYYALFNNEQNATQLFKVVESVRAPALATANADWLTDNAYHRIKVTRAGSAISVYFDDVLMLSANDDTFGVGQVGVGSFNDSACFDEISVTGAVAAIPDTTAPVITLLGDNPQFIPVGSAYTELGASAVDNVNGNISANIMADASEVNTAIAGAYSVTYNVTDAAGNAAIQVTRTVNVTAVIVNDAPEAGRSDGGTTEVVSASGGGGGALGALFGSSLILLAFRRRRNAA
ncbi:MAG TPA: DUF5011 domain-containing protein [Gammaproteobacteria bacterium]|nr:DUF5011 domain-containing protein [Gammaproteobacteria bacterium]